MFDNLAGKGFRNHQEHQPADTVLGECKNAGVQVCVFGRLHSGHNLEVFGSFLLHNIHDVVNGDNTDQPFFRIDNGQGKKGVLLKNRDNAFLIIVRVHIDTFAFKDIFNKLLFGRQHEFF